MAEAPKAGVIAISIIVIVGTLGAIGFTVIYSLKHDENNNGSLSTSTKTALCQSAEYKSTCEETLKSSDSNDPKDLVKIGLQAIMDEIKDAKKNAEALKTETDDNMTRQAFEICDELMVDSIDWLQQTFERVDHFEPLNIDEYLEDLKVWVSGVLSDQTVCKDGFVDTDEDASEKMESFLESARKLTITSLDIIEQLRNVLNVLNIGGGGAAHRRLLSNDDRLPKWMSSDQRRLVVVSAQSLQPNVVVAKDGSGKYKTINESLAEIPKKNMQPFLIYVKEGVYEERLVFTKHMTHVVLYGDGPTKTKITGNLNYADGVQTFKTSTVSILASNFIAKDIGFENSAGPEGDQAVALRVQADKSVFFNCHMNGYQDTLYAQKFRQFYRDCTISGTVDFIFGDAAVVFQNCNMVVRKPRSGQDCMVTAQGRDAHQESTGIVLQNCHIYAERALANAEKEDRKEIKVYLGRPWRQFSRTIVIQSKIGHIVDPQGWEPWPDTTFTDTCYYAEFDNRGHGASMDKRVEWKGYHRINAETAHSFVPGKYLLGDTWIPQTGVPYFSGWMNVIKKES